MQTECQADALPCPHPLARAPRAATETAARLLQTPRSLQGALAAIARRDTRGLALSEAQRLTHFPASLLLTLSWFQGMEGGLVEPAPDGIGGCWRAFASPMVLSGSQSLPRVSWTSSPGRAVSVCFTADVAQALFRLDVAAVHDKVVDARLALGPEWQAMLADLLAAQDDAATLATLERHLAVCWQRVRHGQGAVPSLLRLGRDWVERLGWQARQWAATHSQRQVERRIKTYSGRSLREWQSLVRTEGVFFAARAQYEAGLQPDWAELAQDQGFADQAHLSRASKRITGFAPGAFAKRFIEDESFWLYRLWI
ncbi:helix-turn-helix domain-containing protein [Chromobacterium paludis]|uniref:AraC family transcriptional regulator n=1 Tax=Chromobacterium paludis TaxID=2605945 RepID=A0A5C1DHY8_9NEIS|nr:helix-turn-helix domain-containing protein [Chromobacterium paludis]QEL55278.1 AraC family transcriptional regulator [Chromobacterium paludis]